MKEIISASVTPLTDGGEIDLPSLSRLIDFDLRGGVDGFFFLGSMGEWAVLGDGQREKLVDAATQAVAGRAKVLAGVSASGFQGIVDNMKYFAKYPCDAYVAQCPGGWARPKDVVRYVKGLADASPRPLYFYYLPQVNGVSCNPDQFREIFSHPNIAGIKNSSDSLKARKELLILRREMEFRLFEGQEWNVDESLLLGYDGAVVGMASLGAKLFKSIAKAVDSGDREEAFELQRTMVAIYGGIYGADLSTIQSGQKYALKRLGILASERSLVPAEDRALTEAERQRIEACLAEYGQYLA
jgi:Dihydrodipicolinate synthase/N-acetylneuraminate lyase